MILETFNKNTNTLHMHANVRNWKNYPVYIIGDIHGNFDNLANIITDDASYNNCYIIVAGDCGFGFLNRVKERCRHKETKILKSLNTILKKRKIIVGFLRGNHDNPVYWTNKEYRNKALNIKSLSNIQFIEDNTFIKILSDKWIWCCGGAVSIDRYYRTKDLSWWSDEQFNFPFESYNETITKHNIDKIYACVLHTGPKPRELKNTHNPFEYYFILDKTLTEDCTKEQKDVENCINMLKPTYLYHGHWHMSLNYQYLLHDSSECNIIGLNIDEIIKLK